MVVGGINFLFIINENFIGMKDVLNIGCIRNLISYE